MVIDTFEIVGVEEYKVRFTLGGGTNRRRIACMV